MDLFLQILLKSMQALPVIVTGIEHTIQGSQSGATKKIMALDMLTTAMQTATIATPENAPYVNAFGKIISQTIDSTVDAFNSVGWPQYFQESPATVGLPIQHPVPVAVTPTKAKSTKKVTLKAPTK